MTLQQLRYAVCIAKNKSMNKAAEELYITQPSLSGTIRDLEKEIDTQIFIRSNRGIEITSAGEEFLSYARQLTEQYQPIEEHYGFNHISKKRFSVSMQHYTFAVQAFINVVREFGSDEYEFAVHETKTAEVIKNVKFQKSEIGIIYLNTFNEKAITKILKEDDLEFIDLFPCRISVYLSKNHPMAKKKKLSLDDLKDYPCLSFEQGENNSFYFSEEVFSTYDYRHVIKADDRATFLNMMIGLDAFTLCSGIICEELNGGLYTSIPLDTEDRMRIGYIKKKKMILGRLGERYIEELKKFG